jgi:hypothetical protein
MKSENTKKRVIKVIILVALLFYSVSGVFSQEKRIRVTAEKADIYLQPSISSAVIETVKRDSVLTLRSVIMVRGGWYYIGFTAETGITKTGYIQASLVELTNLPPRIIREEKIEPIQEKEQVVFIPPKKVRIIADEASIMLEPNPESQVIRQVSQGDIYQSGAKVEEWYQIILPLEEKGKGVFGYVHQSLVEEVEDQVIRVPKVKEEKPKILPPPPKPVVPKKETARIEKEVKPKPPQKRNNYIKAGVNYFSPPEQRFKDVYGSGMTYSGEIGIGIWKGLKLWIGGSYFTKKGELFFTKEETKVQIFPMGGGLKYLLTEGSANLYSGMGLYYYQFKETNPIGDVSKGGLGYVGQVGVFVKAIGGLIIDFNLDYSYCRMRPVERSINIGGFQAGIKLGYEF